MPFSDIAHSPECSGTYPALCTAASMQFSKGETLLPFVSGPVFFHNGSHENNDATSQLHADFIHIFSKFICNKTRETKKTILS